MLHGAVGAITKSLFRHFDRLSRCTFRFPCPDINLSLSRSRCLILEVDDPSADRLRAVPLSSPNSRPQLLVPVGKSFVAEPSRSIREEDGAVPKKAGGTGPCWNHHDLLLPSIGGSSSSAELRLSDRLPLPDHPSRVEVELEVRALSLEALGSG